MQISAPDWGVVRGEFSQALATTAAGADRLRCHPDDDSRNNALAAGQNQVGDRDASAH